MIFGRKTGLREGRLVVLFAGLSGVMVVKDAVSWCGKQNKPVNGSQKKNKCL